MLVDPFTIAANAPTPALVMSVIKHDGYASERRNVTGDYNLIIQHTPGKSQTRHYVKLSQYLNAVNPYTGLTQPKAASASLSISVPDFGFDATAMVALVRALIDTVDDSEVTIARILQSQS